ncbi:MAG: glycosyltransferase [Cyclobacteriaceae bacterium]
MKYIFIVQGEGRGHMTQALSLADMLRRHGHTISRVIIGKSDRRVIPKFFLEKIGTPVLPLSSPNFVTDKQQKSVRPWKTIAQSLVKTPAYRKSLKKIDEVVENDDPDFIINFYEFLGGLYYFLKKPRAEMICIGHQYLLNHSSFEFPPNRSLDKMSMMIGNKITSLGASKLLALSFQEFGNEDDQNLKVVPPILRKEVTMSITSNEEHFLVYLLNPGYADEIHQFHADHPDQKLHVFWDQRNADDPMIIDKNLVFHQLNDESFLAYMASCKGYVTTAGFESVCEAMYLGKPVMMVPVAGHFEQACNAIDGIRAGAGISSDTFDISKLSDYLTNHKHDASSFRTWSDRAGEYIIRQMT